MNEKHFAKSLLLFNLIAALHITLGSFVNSSFLEQYLTLTKVGYLYTISAIIGVLLLSQSEKVLARLGGFIPTIILIMVDTLSLFGLAITGFLGININPLIPAVLFISHYSIGVFVLRFAFDTFYEAQSSDENTGVIRGELLTMQNIAWVISPIIFSLLLKNTTQFWKVYFVSFIISTILLILALILLPRGKEPEFKKVYFIETIKKIYARKDLLKIFLIYFSLAFFFSWMIIYLPIYLHDVIGFSWEEIGALLTIMLIPYVLVDIPLGIAADKYFGEKEILIIGFIILIVSTFLLGFISGKVFLVWALILFITRLGAATIEIMSETYFFKKIGAEDGNFISVFRNAQPFAYIIGPFLGSMFLDAGATYGHLFIILSLFMIPGLIYALRLKDTL